MNDSNNGVFFIQICGEAIISEIKLSVKDALGIWGTDKAIEISFFGESKLLAIEVPMN